MPDSLQNEAELWSRARAGNAAARESLGELARSVARDVLSSQGVQAAGIADLAREVARTTFACLVVFADPPRDLRAFLRIRTLDVLADQRRAMRAKLLHHDAGANDGAGAPAEPTAPTPRPRRIAGARRRLPPELREVLELRYERERSCEQAAHALGSDRATVRARTVRALEGVLAHLRPRGARRKDPGASRALSDAETTAVAAWLDGELRGEELTRFEFALAGDRELADEVERLAAADAWLRRLAARRKEPRGLRPWHLAIALLALIACAYVLWRRTGSAPQMSARVVPGWPTAFEFAARRAELRGMRPPGFEILRGQSAVTNVAADDFLAAAQDVLEREARAPDGAETVTASGGSFFVAVVLPRAATLLVYGIPAEGPIVRLFPAPAGENGSPEQARLGAGVQWLPAPPFGPGAGQTVEYAAGFVLPVEVDELEAVVVHAPADFAAEALHALDADVAHMIDGSLERRTAELVTALEKRRLGAHAFRVRKP